LFSGGEPLDWVHNLMKELGPQLRRLVSFATLLIICRGSIAAEPSSRRRVPAELARITVTPQVRATTLRYRSVPESELGVRVQMFVRNTQPSSAGTNASFFCNAVLFDRQEPQALIQSGDWAWHDSPTSWSQEELGVPPGAVVVWSFNTTTTRWGLGKKFPLEITDWQHIARTQLPIDLAAQPVWLSSVTFLSSDGSVLPDLVVFHIENQSRAAVKIISAQLYLPENSAKWRILLPQPALNRMQTFPEDGTIPPGDQGCGRAQTDRLPLTYAALQVMVADAQGNQSPLWAYLRIKREFFDIGGGWVQNSGVSANTLTNEAFLKTLQRMHVNTARITSVPGYTDQTSPQGLYSVYPLKRFGKLEPLADYDQDALLPFIHGIDIVGKPQAERGGVPRFPQAVEQALVNYAKNRLPTSVTLSDESTWCRYAGLSDYPSFEAFRVSAPSADDWDLYDRWEGRPIIWGAPLETIGDLCRSLRELSRPAPIAAWSQGPYYGWDILEGRRRTSPTPDELRLQAYHALSSRITSLYWYNLSPRSLVQYRDTIEEITRVNREIRMLDDFYLNGNAYRYQQVRRDGKPDWDLASIVSPRGALLFALDLDYTPNRSSRVFEFSHRREASFSFALPAYLRRVADVFRVDAEGLYPVNFNPTDQGVQIADKAVKVAIYVATPFTEMRTLIEAKRQTLIVSEQALNFDPANKNRDFDLLKAGLLQK
jgi:hypothetical protein